MLASGYTSRKAAEALNVTAKTLCQWNARTDFRMLVDQLLNESQAEAARALSGLAAHAVERLAELLTSNNESVAQRAISIILDHRADRQPTYTPSGTTDAWNSILARVCKYEKAGAE